MILPYIMSFSATGRPVPAEPGRHPAAEVQPGDLHPLLRRVRNSAVCRRGTAPVRPQGELHRALSVEDYVIIVYKIILASVNSCFYATKLISIVLLCNSLILRGKMYREEGTTETRICLLKTRNIE